MNNLDSLNLQRCPICKGNAEHFAGCPNMGKAQPIGFIKNAEIKRDSIKATTSIEKCPECGMLGGRHWSFCSKANSGASDPKPHFYLHGNIELDKSKIPPVVKKFHMTHATVDENFLGKIKFLKETDGLFVTSEKYNALKRKFNFLIIFTIFFCVFSVVSLLGIYFSLGGG